MRTLNADQLKAVLSMESSLGHIHTLADVENTIDYLAKEEPEAVAGVEKFNIFDTMWSRKIQAAFPQSFVNMQNELVFSLRTDSGFSLKDVTNETQLKAKILEWLTRTAIKAVLLSIRPEWCDLILRGKKTMEVRKNYPKHLYEKGKPFKVYIYCTKAPQQLITIFKDGEETMDGEIHHGKPVFVKFDKLLPDSVRGKTQMVVGEFVCDKIYEVAPLNHTPDDFEQQACMDRDQIWEYLHGQGWAWHISELKIYDQPRPLETYTRLLQTGCCFEPLKVKRAPQSWCYVEDAECTS